MVRAAEPVTSVTSRREGRSTGMRPLLLVVLAISLAACGSAEREAARRARRRRWERLPDPPLGPREAAAAVPAGGRRWSWAAAMPTRARRTRTARHRRSRCCAMARCTTRARGVDEDRRRAGRAGLRLAAVVGGDVHLLAPGQPWDGGASPAFLRYRPAEDGWTRLPVPRARRSGRSWRPAIRWSRRDLGRVRARCRTWSSTRRTGSGASSPTTRCPRRSTGRWRGTGASSCCSRTRSCRIRAGASRR